MKRVISCILVLAIAAGLACAPICASATTANDCIEYFCALPVGEYYREDLEKLAKVVPCSEEQAAQVMTYLKTIKEISDRFNGPEGMWHNNPSGYTAADIQLATETIQKISDVLNVEMKMVHKKAGEVIGYGTGTHSEDSIWVEFSYNGKTIYSYDGDVIEKTGTEASNTPLYIGLALLVSAAVATVVVYTVRRKNETIA